MLPALSAPGTSRALPPFQLSHEGTPYGEHPRLSSLHPSLALRRASSARRVPASTHFSCPARVPSVWRALGTPELYIPVLQLSYQSTLSAGTFRTTQHNAQFISSHLTRADPAWSALWPPAHASQQVSPGTCTLHRGWPYIRPLLKIQK